MRTVLHTLTKLNVCAYTSSISLAKFSSLFILQNWCPHSKTRRAFVLFFFFKLKVSKKLSYVYGFILFTSRPPGCLFLCASDSFEEQNKSKSFALRVLKSVRCAHPSPVFQLHVAIKSALYHFVLLLKDLLRD